MTDTTPIRRAFIDASDDEITNLANEIRSALEGDSNDDEHDALQSVASFLGIETDIYVPGEHVFLIYEELNAVIVKPHQSGLYIVRDEKGRELDVDVDEMRHA